MAIYDIEGNAIYSDDQGIRLNNSQIDSVYALIQKTAYLSNIDNEIKDFEQSFNLTRDSLYPIENVDSDFTITATGHAFHARITRGYHVSLVFHRYETTINKYVVSFTRMQTYKNVYDNLPSMYTFPANEQIEIGVSNVVQDGVVNFAIRNRLANSDQNGNVRTGEITSTDDFTNVITLTNEEQTGTFYIFVQIGKAEASLEFDFNLKVGDELWV